MAASAVLAASIFHFGEYSIWKQNGYETDGCFGTTLIDIFLQFLPIFHCLETLGWDFRFPFL